MLRLFVRVPPSDDGNCATQFAIGVGLFIAGVVTIAMVVIPLALHPGKLPRDLPEGRGGKRDPVERAGWDRPGGKPPRSLGRTGYHGRTQRLGGSRTDAVRCSGRVCGRQ